MAPFWRTPRVAYRILRCGDMNWTDEVASGVVSVTMDAFPFHSYGSHTSFSWIASRSAVLAFTFNVRLAVDILYLSRIAFASPSCKEHQTGGAGEHCTRPPAFSFRMSASVFSFRMSAVVGPAGFDNVFECVALVTGPVRLSPDR
ncbi:Uncharacterized protein PBTT_03538 [Plasmodiophora brassicae]